MLRRALTLAVVLTALPSPAGAQRFEVTPFVGYRLGGGLEDFEIGGDEFDFDDNNSLGVILGYEVQDNAFIEFLYSTQETNLEEAGGFLGDKPLFEVDVDYWHFGGLYQWDIRSESVMPYVAATLGVTVFDPQPAELDGETRFSMSIGGGFKLVLGKNVALRFEGRGFSTVVDSESEVFCDNSRCYTYNTGTYLWQFETSAGVVVVF